MGRIKEKLANPFANLRTAWFSGNYYRMSLSTQEMA